MKRKIIPYNPKLKELARKLRNNSTLAEIILWKHLKGRQIKGYDFHRQKPLLNYIVDFFCHELMLAIEVDGYTHQFEEVFKKDQERQKELESIGIIFLRFDDADVRKNVQSAIAIIEAWIDEFEMNSIHTPSPSEEGNNTGTSNA